MKSPIAKFWVALILGIVMAGLVFLEGAVKDGTLNAVEIVQLLIALIGVPYGVWQIPNSVD